MRRFEGFERGVNLGGWFAQVANPSEEHYNTYITEDDIKRISEWGLDHVRVPVDYFVLEEDDGTIKPQGYVHLDRCLSWCRKYNLRMILDIHEAYGYSFDPMDNTDKEIFFHSEKLQEHFYDFWRNISRHFANDYEYVAYELLNEIVSFNVADEWNMIADKTIAAIREDSPKSWIIYGGVCYNAVSSVKMLRAPQDDKIVHTFHCYEPMIFTHQGAFWVKGMPTDFRTNYPVTEEAYKEIVKLLPADLAQAIDPNAIKIHGPEFFEKIFESALEAAKKNNVPLYCGEYGVIDLADVPNTLNWLSDINATFKKYNIARSYWNFKGMDYEICGPRCASRIDELVAML